jgi:hypothetical protein
LAPCSDGTAAPAKIISTSGNLVGFPFALTVFLNQVTFTLFAQGSFPTTKHERSSANMDEPVALETIVDILGRNEIARHAGDIFFSRRSRRVLWPQRVLLQQRQQPNSPAARAIPKNRNRE